MSRTVLLPLLLLVLACSSETKHQSERPAGPETGVRPAVQGDTATANAAAGTDSAAYWQRALADPDLKPAERRPYYVDEAGYDFSWVWSAQDNQPLGFIGDHYERLRVVILTAEQDAQDAGLYRVTGKTKVRNNICPFEGTIRVRHVREAKESGVRPEQGEATDVAGRGAVVGACEFREAKGGAHTGVFTGMLVSYWYVTGNDLKAKPDPYREEGGDGPTFPNNAFVGEWRSYDGKLRNRVAWGEGRIPDAGVLDIGAGEFMPDAQFEKYGWKSYAEAMRSTDESAWAKERAQWW